MTNVVILGAGTAGTMTANKLRAAHPDLDITIVDRDNEHHYQPGYLFLPFDIYTDDDIVEPRTDYIHDGIRLILAEIDRVDANAQRVCLGDGQELAYDWLIIATGVAPRRDLVPGMDDLSTHAAVHEFYTLDGARKLRDVAHQWDGGRVVVHISEMPIKCPVAPMEFIFLAEDWLDQRGLRRKTQLTYVTPLDGAFTKPVASRELAHALEQRGIALETDFMIERVDTEAKAIVGYDGREIGYDVLITVPPNLGADYIARSGLGDELNLVPCDPHTMQSTVHEEIFVLGDAGTLPTSKAGSVAHFSVEIFMENFAQILRGEPMTHRFDGHANCFIESGRSKGMLLDFNYDTEPLTGKFPFPVVGPMTLLGESRANHLGKLAFKWVYWHMLLHGRPIPLPADMFMMGKAVESPAVESKAGS